MMPPPSRHSGADRKAFGLLLLLIMVIIGYVFRDHLLLNRVYLFTDIGSDSVNIYLPRILHLADYLRSEGWPGWSFSMGMGQNLFPGSFANPFDMILLALGRDRLIYGIVYVTALKSLLGGAFFFLYLRTLGLVPLVAICGGLFYAFSGFMIVGGGWTIFATEAVYIALLLWAFERYLMHSRWGLFPVACTLLAVENPMALYTAGAFLAIYATVRYLDVYGWHPKALGGVYLKLMGMGALGVAMGGLFVMALLIQMVESPRVLGDASLVGKLKQQSAFGLASVSHYASVVARIFSSDLIGSGSRFRGWYNYLESPMIYIGLAPLVFAPLGWWGMDRRRRFLYGAFVGIFVLAMVFPFFRHGFWLFTGDYYRSFSLYCIFPILLLGLFGLQRAVKEGRINGLIMVGSMVALMAILLLLPRFSGPLDSGVRNAIWIFIALYGVIGWGLSHNQFRRGATILLVLVVATEVGYFSAVSVTQRVTVPAEQIEGRFGYNDATRDALKYLQTVDPGAYRIIKDFDSSPAMVHRGLNDAMAQGFWGISSYHSFNQLNYVRFLGEMGMIDPKNEVMSRWLNPPKNQPLLLLFSGVKYLLSRGGNPLGIDQRIVRPLGLVGDIRIYQLPDALPLAFTYDRYFPLDAFRKLPVGLRQVVLLRAVVVGNPAWADGVGLQNEQSRSIDTGLDQDLRRRTQEPFQIAISTHNTLQGSIHLDAPQMLFFSIPFDRGWHATVDGKPATLQQVNIGFMGLMLTPGQHEVTLYYRQPFLLPGILVSVCGVGGYLWLLRRSRKANSEVHD